MMVSSKTKSLIRQYGIFYFIAFVIIFGMKYHYSKAGSDDLDWILAPVAWWVKILSGITFEKESNIGYINHHFRFIIAPSCSGVQFMIITFATLVYSFLHRMKTIRSRFYWIGISLFASYLFTIFVNGFRIIISIYLPLYLHIQDIDSGWLTPERLHTMEGSVVYFVSLLIIYHAAGYVSQKIAGIHFKHPGKSFIQMICKCMPPIFWYFFIALGIPYLNKAYKNDSENFMEYAMLVTAVCFTIIFLFCLASVLRERSAGQRKS